MEHTMKTNGLKVRSWGDLAAIVAIMAPTLAMLLATVMWGLKLEGELNLEREHGIQRDRRLTSVERQVDEGVLKVAKQRLDEQQQRIERLEQQHFNGRK